MDGETTMEPLTAVNCTVNEILWAWESMVGLPYDGEPVDQLEHALQCAALTRGKRVAWLAEQPGLEDYRAELSHVVSAQLACP